MPSLPERQREVIRMRLFEELPLQEKAVRLGCTEVAQGTRNTKPYKALGCF